MKIAGVPEPFNLPLRLAIEDGVFDDDPVEYIDYPGGTGAMTAALAAGEIDAAILLTEGGVYDIARGSDNRLVKVFVESPLVWGIHVAAGSQLESPADVEGTRVAISRCGSGSHLIAIVDAIERGFETSAMSFVVVDNIDGARKALAAGDADIFLWEKHMTQPLVDNGEFRRTGERVVPWPAFSVSVRKGYAESHGATLRRVFEETWRYTRQLLDRADRVPLVSSRYGVSETDADRWLSTVRWQPGFDRPDDALSRVLEALIAQGSLAATDFSLDDLWFRI